MTTSAVETSVPGSQSVRSSGFQIPPRNSWTMKRATRVPASMVVRMNSASNMIAKWYQYDIRPRSAGRPEKICAKPTASETAPPVRPVTFSPTSRESSARCTGESPRFA